MSRLFAAAALAAAMWFGVPGFARADSNVVSNASPVNSSGTSTVPLSAPGVTLTGSGCVTLQTGCTLCGDSAGGAVFTSPDGGAVTMPAYQLEPDGGFRWDTASGTGTAEFVCPASAQVYFCEQSLTGVHFNAVYIGAAYFNDWNNNGGQARIRNIYSGSTSDVEIDNLGENVDLIRGYYGDGTSLVYRVTDAGTVLAGAYESQTGGAAPLPAGVVVGASGSPLSNLGVSTQGGCSMASAATCTVAVPGCTSSSACFATPYSNAATSDAVGVQAQCAAGTATLTAKSASVGTETFNVWCAN